MTEVKNTPKATVQLVEGRKSLAQALILTFLFGPIGVLYVSPMWGLMMILLGAVVGIFSLGLGLIFVWPLSMILAGVLVFVSNGRLKRKMERAVS